MKKILSVALAVVMLFALSVSVFAAVDTSDWKTVVADNPEVSFKVTYTTNVEGVIPAETLAFTSTAATSNPDGGTANLTIDPVTVNGTPVVVPVTLPQYEKVGVYTYTIKMTEGNTQGVTYETDKEISITVLVVYDYENECLKIEEAGVTADKDGNKEDTLENQYAVGKLSVQKKVTGNLGDKNKLFTIHVTLTAAKNVWSDITISGGSDASNTQTITGDGWTGSKNVDIKLKDGETVTFSNIPEGVTYEVVEDENHTKKADVNSEEGYTATYEKDTGSIVKDETQAAIVTNEKKTDINTGISLDSLPYILIGVAVLAALVVMILRRRRAQED
jgi:hypothetical protein